MFLNFPYELDEIKWCSKKALPARTDLKNVEKLTQQQVDLSITDI